MRGLNTLHSNCTNMELKLSNYETEYVNKDVAFF